MTELSLMEAMDDLVSAEDFLVFFDIDFDSTVVHVNRLHILQRFHDYLAKAGPLPVEEVALRQHYRQWLAQAYDDFVASDSRTEKVFKVFHMHEPKETFVSLDQLMR